MSGMRHDVDPFVIEGFRKHSRSEFESRFWSKTDRTAEGCWQWNGYKLPHEYGTFAVARCQMRLAHRVAWELTNGEIPEGMRVIHSCDNPSCVNPEHLRLGTAKDNTRDMLTKWRHAHGERHPKTALTEEQVLAIRSLRMSSDLSYAKIGNRFGVSATSVYKIVRRTRWVHI